MHDPGTYIREWRPNEIISAWAFIKLGLIKNAKSWEDEIIRKKWKELCEVNWVVGSADSDSSQGSSNL